MTKPSAVPISKRLVLVNSISGMTTRLLTAGVFAWVIQYLMKRIPEEELALLPIVLSLALVLPMLQTILTGGMSRFVTEAYAKHDELGVTRIVSSQFPLLVLCGLGVLLLGSALAWNIDHILVIAPAYVGKARAMMFMIVARIVFGIIVAPFNTGLYALQKFVVQNSLEVCGSLLRITLMVAFLLKIGPRVEWVIAAQVIAQMIQQAASTVISMRLLPSLRYRPGLFDWPTCRRVLSFSGWSFFTEAANVIRRSADAPILNIFSTSVAVNDFFLLGSLFDTQLRAMTITASQPLMPALTAMHAHDQHERLAAAFLRGGRIALWVAMFLAAPLMVFSHDLFALYLGNMYRDHVDAANVMIILMLSLPLSYPTMMFYRIAYARGELGPLAVRSVLAQIGNLALTLLFVGYYHLGSIGSAVATLVSFIIVEPFFNWPLALRTLDIPWRRFITKTLIPGIVPAVVASLVGVGTLYLCGESHWVRVLVGIPVCLAAYAVTALLLLAPADRADLGKILDAVRSHGKKQFVDAPPTTSDNSVI